MSTFLRLRNPIGPTYNTDEGDTLLTKHLLADVGSFEVPGYGITKWPDEPLFSGVRDFQKRNSLEVDSVLLPGGPTEERLNRRLTESLLFPFLGAADDDHIRDEQQCRSPIQPAIQIPPGIFRRNRDDFCPTPKWPEDKCDEQLEADLRRCALIAGGNREVYRVCQKTAMERYAACIANRPLPPLYEG